ncbi:MAG: MlaD family protein [Planctomycetota bacterium]
MTEAQRNTAVGLTVIGGLVGLAFLLVLFGYVPAFLNPKYAITIDLPDAAGLSRGSAVSYRGIHIGDIRSVELTSNTNGGSVQMVAHVERKVSLPADIHAEVMTNALIGGAKLMLVSDHDPSAARLPTDGSDKIQGRVLSPFDSIAGDLADSISGPLKRIGGFLDKYEQLAIEWREVAVNIQALTAARTVEDVDDGSAPANIATVIARADARMAELKQAIAGINDYVNDETLRDDVRATVANAKQLTAAGRDTMVKAQDAVDEIKASVKALETRYVAAADDLSAAVTSARDLLDKARAGDGTAGKLLNDPALYNNLTDAAERMNLVLKRLELLVERWRDEGIEISF